MRHVMGANAPKKELRKAARQVFRNVGRYYADLIRMPHLNVDQFFRQRLTYHGFEEYLLPAVNRGKGVIITSAHFGSAELAVQGLLAGGVKVVVLTEPLHPPSLSRLIDRLRSSKGHTFLPVSFTNVKTAVRTVRAGGVLALMCDRDIEGKSIRVPFFGTPTQVPVGAVEMAMRTGAAILPTFSRRTKGNGIEVFIESRLDMASTGSADTDLKENVRRLLERVEPHLRRDPGQWAVLEAIWDDAEDTRPSTEEER